MKTSVKTTQDVNNLRDLRTYTGTVRKSAKPALPTTAILDLYMRRNERDRLVKELKKLKKRREQLLKRLKEIEKEMSKLLAQAAKTAKEIRGSSTKGGGGNPSSSSKKKGKMVVGY
ncbi:MAG: hypothetical protein Q8N59_01545 [bacterium]|nr:hypothetical protein [bacterium]